MSACDTVAVFSARGKLFGVLAFGVMLLLPTAAASAKSSPGQIACNGSSGLCERKLNDVVLPGSHNSMSAKELEWFNPNQTYSMPNQLRRGARAMLFDTYYGDPQPNGQVRNVGKAQGKADGAPIYLCHESCLFGASALIPELRKIADFLEANPYETLVFVNQDAIDPVDFAGAVEAAGLLSYAYTGPAGPWPTLGEMISSNQRVVFLAEQDAAGVPWYHRMEGGPLRETPYTFPGGNEITNPERFNESCRPGRGEGSATGDSLFLMNHWASSTDPGSFKPLISKAEIVNTKATIVARARACEARRGFLPNILAVDFFGTGDVVGAADGLNGVSAKAKLSSSRIKRASVRAGKRAVMRVTIRNRGDAPAGSVKICASVSGKLASRPRCARAGELRAGAVSTVKIRIKTRKKARGSTPVRFRITSDAGSASARATLRVKPAKPKRRS